MPANKQSPDSSPTVSRLPLPVTDSALVIDLPDGQKIVVGKMTQGSVIEVATWRGVGRPDSRTSRLMLGVGSGDVNEVPSSQQDVSTSAPRKVKPQGWKIVLYYLSLVIEKVSSIKWKRIFTGSKALMMKIKLPKRTKLKLAAGVATTTPSTSVQTLTSPTSPTSRSTVDEDVEAWLNKISEKASKRSALEVKPPRPAVKKSTSVKKAATKTAVTKSKRK